MRARCRVGARRGKRDGEKRDGDARRREAFSVSARGAARASRKAACASVSPASTVPDGIIHWSLCFLRSADSRATPEFISARPPTLAMRARGANAPAPGAPRRYEEDRCRASRAAQHESSRAPLEATPQQPPLTPHHARAVFALLRPQPEVAHRGRTRSNTRSPLRLSPIHHSRARIRRPSRVAP